MLMSSRPSSSDKILNQPWRAAELLTAGPFPTPPVSSRIRSIRGAAQGLIGGRRAFSRTRRGLAMSMPVENVTVPPIENLTDRRGDERQTVAPS